MVEAKKRTVHLMGTVIDLLVEHPSAEILLDEVVRRLKAYEQRFSANDPKSELMEVNRNAGIRPVSVHPELYELIKVGCLHSQAPDSNLNIAIGPLVQTWRIGFGDAKVPSAGEIAGLLERTNPRYIRLNDEEQAVFLQQPGMLIDLGALAKGYIADRIIDYLKSQGVSTALLNLGGNIVALGPAGNPEKTHWNIGIQNPLLPRNESLVVLPIANQSVVTSGIYERSLESDGTTYHHILNPKTGYPVTSDVASLTVISDRSVDGEIWTTRLYGKSSQEILESLDQVEGIEGLVITKEAKLLYSKGLEQNMRKEVMK